MQELTIAALVVLLALHLPVSSSAKLLVSNLGSVATPGRRLSESKPAQLNKTTLMVDLMAYHHVNSPYVQPNLTLSQKVEIAVKSSQARGKFFASKKFEQFKEETYESKTVYSTPDYFSMDGAYLMEISLGTPIRKLRAFLDTGSNLVWVQCAGCQPCLTELDPVFNPQDSSSYASINCSAKICISISDTVDYCTSAGTCLYDYKYGDQSTTHGYLATETISLLSTSGATDSYTSFVFGCGTQNKFKYGGLDGIVGLGLGQLSLVSQLGTYIGHVFSYCLVDFDSASNVTSPLIFGSAGNIALTYTPLVNNSYYPSHYYINLVGITVAGQPLAYPSDTFLIDPSNGHGGVILDSGTTLMLMATGALTPLVTALSSLISYPQVNQSRARFELCYNTSTVSGAIEFPVVVIQFDGLNVTLPDNNLFLLVDTGIFCLAMVLPPDTVHFNIYGAVQQQNFQIAYDIANSQIGMAPAQCS